MHLSVSWFALCRDVCYITLDRAVQMSDEGEVVEIDEYLLRGKRKNNKGRYIAGDIEHLQAKRAKKGRNTQIFSTLCTVVVFCTVQDNSSQNNSARSTLRR
jgi:hypothetical protein